MKPSHLLRQTAVIAAFALCSLPVSGASYTFQQSGFDGGGSLSGTFSGAAGGDGVLTLDELTEFSLSFGGDSIIEAFSLVKTDLAQFVYNADGGTLGDQPNEGILDLNANFLAGPAVTGLPQETTIVGAEVFTVSNTAISVSAVPEPSTAAFLMAGLALVVLRFRRR